MALFGNRVRLGDLLIQEGLITEEQLQLALEEQKNRKSKLGETLLAMGFLSQEDFSRVLSEQLGIESVDLRTVGMEDGALKLVSEDIMKKYDLIPFGFEDGNMNVLKVAMADPMNLGAIDDLSLITNMMIKAYFAPAGQIAIQLDRMFGRSRLWKLRNSSRKSMQTNFWEKKRKKPVKLTMLLLLRLYVPFWNRQSDREPVIYI